jgi:hypothetical protein
MGSPVYPVNTYPVASPVQASPGVVQPLQPHLVGPPIPTPWQPSYAYALNDQFVDPAGLVQRVTIAGTSGPSEPKFNAFGQTTAEGPDTLVWTAQGKYVEPFLVGRTIVSLRTQQKGSTQVLDFLCTDNVHYFIKSSHNQIEIGGDEFWGTGVLQP